jgi:hypothetical protein
MPSRVGHPRALLLETTSLRAGERSLQLRCRVGLACTPAYTPRQTLDSDLVAVLREHLPSFIEHAEASGASLPLFAVNDLEGVLRCGDFEHGFLRLKCRRCGDELRVPFSCKLRSTCPSCMGRRMGELATLWTDHLLPAVPYRQSSAVVSDVHGGSARLRRQALGPSLTVAHA